MDNLQLIYEDWAYVPQYEGLYFISNRGRVLSFKRIVAGKTGRGARLMPECYLKMKVTKGYIFANLSKNGGRYPMLLHRIVAKVFVAGYFEGAQVNHINGIKLVNVWWNLEWTTQSENLKHAIRMGLKPVIKGLDHYCCKKVFDTETGKTYPSVNEAAKATGIKFSTIYYRARFSKTDTRFSLVA